MSTPEKDNSTLDKAHISNFGETIDYETILDAVCNPGDVPGNPNLKDFCNHPRPSRTVIFDCVEMLRSVLFPGYFGYENLTLKNMRVHVLTTLDRALSKLLVQIIRAVCFTCTKKTKLCKKCECEDRSKKILSTFANRLPEVRRLLSTDARVSFNYDPATVIPDEPVFCYPGMFAMTNFRLAKELYKLEVPLIPRIITEYAHDITGIDIHPGAEIGESMFIDHGTGVVIGQTAIVGSRVRIYQGVTLGIKRFELDKNGLPIKLVPRHPIIEDDVVIYSNTSILGRIRVGRGSVIAANVRLTRDVPPASIVLPAAARFKIIDPETGEQRTPQVNKAQ